MTAKRPKRNKVISSVYLTPEQMAGLRDISKKTWIPMSALIRHGVDLVLKRYRREAAE